MNNVFYHYIGHVLTGAKLDNLDCVIIKGHTLHSDFQLLPSGRSFLFQDAKPDVIKTVLFQLLLH